MPYFNLESTSTLKVVRGIITVVDKCIYNPSEMSNPNRYIIQYYNTKGVKCDI